MTGDRTQAYAAHVERVIAATPGRVWTALTTDELAEWFWPERFQTDVRIDAVVGGRFRIASSVVGMAVEGEFVAVEPFRRLVYTWRWDGEQLETLVTMTLEPFDDGTALTIDHERFVSPDECTSHEQGWNDCIGRLVERLADSS